MILTDDMMMSVVMENDDCDDGNNADKDGNYNDNSRSRGSNNDDFVKTAMIMKMIMIITMIMIFQQKNMICKQDLKIPLNVQPLRNKVPTEMNK